jgi:hypothetical protein
MHFKSETADGLPRTVSGSFPRNMNVLSKEESTSPYWVNLTYSGNLMHVYVRQAEPWYLSLVI